MKELEEKDAYKSNDYNQVRARLNYLKEIKGLGVITGEVGSGKTFSIRCFTDKLNKELYKVIYISSSEDLTVFDFYKIIADNLNISVGACYRNDLYKNIQNKIIKLVEEERIQPVIVIDDAQRLKLEILINLKYLYEFKIDSKDYTIIIMCGNEKLVLELNRKIYESLKQRIIVNYKLNGLSREETKEYVKTRYEISNVKNEIFTEDALNALYSCSKGSIRNLNTLILNSMMLGYQNKIKKIDSKIVMEAKLEMDLS